MLETINQLRKLKLETPNKLFFNKVWNLIQLTLTLILEANILYKVHPNPLSLMVDLQSKVNLPKIKWNPLSPESKLNMINKVFPIWVKKNCNQKFWMKLLKLETLERKVFSKNLFKKFKRTKTFQNRIKSKNQNNLIIKRKNKKKIIDMIVCNNFWLLKRMKTSLRERLILDLQWSAKVKELSLLVLLRCSSSNRFKKRALLEVFLQLNFWLKVFNNWVQKEEWRTVTLYQMEHILHNLLNYFLLLQIDLLVENLQRKELSSVMTKMVLSNLILTGLLLENFTLTKQ